MTIYWAETSVANIDTQCREAVTNKQANLTFPRGALGILGRLSALFAGWQGVTTPQCSNVIHKNFCRIEGYTSGFEHEDRNKEYAGDGDHKQARVKIKPINEGVNYGSSSKYDNKSRIRRDIRCDNHVWHSILAGRQVLPTENADLLVAHSLEERDHIIALEGLSAQSSFALDKSSSPELAAQLLSEWGSPTISAMTGAYIRSAQLGMPILVNSTVATAAALAAIKFNQGVSNWMIFSHTSEHFFHKEFIAAIGADAVLESTKLDTDHTELAIDVISSTLAVHARMMNTGLASNDELKENRHLN